VRKNLIPRYVLQTAEESYACYVKRLEAYISTIELRQVAEILSSIDVTEPRNQATVEFLLKHLNSRNKTCALI